MRLHQSLDSLASDVDGLLAKGGMHAAGAVFVSLLRQAVRLPADPEAPARRSADPGDDYLLALAEQERAVLVSGDQHLLALAGELPILTPRALRRH